MLRDWVVANVGRIKVGRYFIHIGIPGAPKFDEFLESIGMPAVRTVNLDVHTSLVAEGMEVLFQVDFGILVLIAGDNNYIPLVKKFKTHGKTVIVMFFPEATGRWLKSQCDEFVDVTKALPEMISESPSVEG